jgi:hypothetical protein
MKIKQRDFAEGDVSAIKTQGEFDDKKQIYYVRGSL